jgi:biotin carboxyl carrier protein
MRFVATIGTRRLVIGLEENGSVRRVSLDGRDLTVDWRPVGAGAAPPGSEHAGHFSLLIGARSFDVYVRPAPQPEGGTQVFEVTLGGETFVVGLRDERAQALESLAGEGHVSGDVLIRAPMPGLVSNIVAAEGEAVQRGQPVIVLEAMKMENDLTSPRTGVVKSLRVSKGQAVNQNDVLAVVGDPPGAPAAEAEDE